MITSISPIPVDFKQPVFLVDWMITKYCNLDCSYCDAYSHDNHSPHPKFQETLDTIDFIYQYTDLHMKYKPDWQRSLVLNVYGGEGMIHPNIVEILDQLRIKHEPYKDNWPLTVLITTNGVIGKNVMNRVIDRVDWWTVSIHSEALPKQREQALQNLKLIHDSGKGVRAVIMMHAVPERWQICMDAIEFCKANGIDYTAKALDTNDMHDKREAMAYTAEQMHFIKNYWIDTSEGTGKSLIEETVEVKENTTIARSQGRACCGGRSICINQEPDNIVTAVPMQHYKDWYCSVNWYFLHINQHSGEIYNNKDCRTSLYNKVEPVGYIKDMKSILDQHRHWLETKTMPVIKCIKTECLCGMCAPKAKDFATFKQVMRSHWLEDPTVAQ